MQDFKQYRSEELANVLDQIKTYLEQDNLSLANVFLRLYEDEIPEGSSAAEEAKKRLDEIYSWYDPVKKKLENEKKTGKLLELPDIDKALYRLKTTLFWKKYYVFKRIYFQFHLFEDNSIVDYEL